MTSVLRLVQCGLISLVLIALIGSKANANVPPDQMELTSSEMSSLGFKFKLRRNKEGSWIDLYFPKTLPLNGFSVDPHSTEVIVTDKSGRRIANSINWVADNEYRTLAASYRQADSDLSVSVTYACPRNRTDGCYGAKRFVISSVSRFFRLNTAAVNLPPKCKQITPYILDCTESD